MLGFTCVLLELAPSTRIAKALLMEGADPASARAVACTGCADLIAEAKRLGRRGFAAERIWPRRSVLVRWKYAALAAWHA
jgi:hypothetical protein